MGVWNGGIVSQLTEDVIKRLGGDVAWRHVILFALRRGNTIRNGRISDQKNLTKIFMFAGFGVLRKIDLAPYNLELWLYPQKTSRP
jgi:hypothetical protein